MFENILFSFLYFKIQCPCSFTYRLLAFYKFQLLFPFLFSVWTFTSTFVFISISFHFHAHFVCLKMSESFFYICHSKSSKLQMKLNSWNMSIYYSVCWARSECVLFDREMSISIVIDEASSVMSGRVCFIRAVLHSKLHRY